MTFRTGGKKIKVKTTQAKAPPSPLLPMYVESINMLEVQQEEEAVQYFVDHTHIVPLYEINVGEFAGIRTLNVICKIQTHNPIFKILEP